MLNHMYLNLALCCITTSEEGHHCHCTMVEHTTHAGRKLFMKIHPTSMVFLFDARYWLFSFNDMAHLWSALLVVARHQYFQTWSFAPPEAHHWVLLGEKCVATEIPGSSSWFYPPQHLLFICVCVCLCMWMCDVNFPLLLKSVITGQGCH